MPARLLETRDGEYVVNDEAFEALMHGWNSAVATVVAFHVTDRKSILGLYLDVHSGEGDEDDE